ncbi:hypothetical protein RUM43_005749 [Polyplax serrata]|uniref:Uncharacterized protein n=1 Tax=Polyplax serrata TaxID=468196 RepID=A0AAN8RUX1_POLSC
MAGSPRSLLTAPDEGWKVPRSRQVGKEEPPGAVRLDPAHSREVKSHGEDRQTSRWQRVSDGKWPSGEEAGPEGKTRARENSRSFNDELTRRRPRKELETSRGCSRGGKKRGPREEEEEEEEEDEPRIREPTLLWGDGGGWGFGWWEAWR